MKDKIIKALMCNSTINVYAISAKELVEKARNIHNTSFCCTAALGRALMGCVMMGAMQKGEKDKVTVIIKGGGIGGNIVCVASSNAKVKGYIANPSADLPLRSDGKIDVGGIVGNNGTITVVRDIGLKEPYVGQADLLSGEIAEDFAAYFVYSEQQPTIVYLGVHISKENKIASAGGLIIQPLPNCPDVIINLLENRAKYLPQFCDLLESEENIQSAIEKLLGDMDIEYTDDMSVEFECDCNRKRLEGVIVSLGEKEIRDMIEKDKGAQLTCHFCNTQYNFDSAQLENLLAYAKQK